MNLKYRGNRESRIADRIHRRDTETQRRKVLCEKTNGRGKQGKQRTV